MKSYKILVDTNLSCKETAAVVGLLSQFERIDFSGVLFSEKGGSYPSYTLSNDRAFNVGQTNHFFHDVFKHGKFFLIDTFLRLPINKILYLIRMQHNLYSLDPLYSEVVWRNFLSHYLAAADRHFLAGKSFYFTDMVHQASGRLNTFFFDFVIFFDFNSVNVSRETKKIIYLSEKCLKEGLPINKMKKCPNTYFVCGTEVMKKGLKNLYVISPDLSKSDRMYAWLSLLERIKLEPVV